MKLPPPVAAICAIAFIGCALCIVIGTASFYYSSPERSGSTTSNDVTRNTISHINFEQFVHMELPELETVLRVLIATSSGITVEVYERIHFNNSPRRSWTLTDDQGRWAVSRRLHLRSDQRRAHGVLDYDDFVALIVHTPGGDVELDLIGRFLYVSYSTARGTGSLPGRLVVDDELGSYLAHFTPQNGR